jgi:hypothetical protein
MIIENLGVDYGGRIRFRVCSVCSVVKKGVAAQAQLPYLLVSRFSSLAGLRALTCLPRLRFRKRNEPNFFDD